MIWFSETNEGLFEAREVGARVPELILLGTPSVLAPSHYRGGFCYSVPLRVYGAEVSEFVLPVGVSVVHHQFTELEVSLGSRGLSVADTHHWHRVIADVGGAFFCCGRLDELDKYARWLRIRGEIPPLCACSLQE